MEMNDIDLEDKEEEEAKPDARATANGQPDRNDQFTAQKEDEEANEREEARLQVRLL